MMRTVARWLAPAQWAHLPRQMLPRLGETMPSKRRVKPADRVVRLRVPLWWLLASVSAQRERWATLGAGAIALLLITGCWVLLPGGGAPGLPRGHQLTTCPASCTVKPIAPADRVLGTAPALETVVRLKIRCSVPAGGRSSYVLPAGDYQAASIDSRGVYYRAPNGVAYEEIPGAPFPKEGGIYLPVEAGRYSEFSVWLTELHWDLITIVPRKMTLPERCWRPWGMVLVHNGVEITPEGIGR